MSDDTPTPVLSRFSTKRTRVCVYMNCCYSLKMRLNPVGASSKINGISLSTLNICCKCSYIYKKGLSICRKYIIICCNYFNLCNKYSYMYKKGLSLCKKCIIICCNYFNLCNKYSYMYKKGLSLCNNHCSEIIDIAFAKKSPTK